MVCMINVMQIGIVIVWYVEVNDVVDVRNINFVCCDVGCDQYVNVIVGEMFNIFVMFDLCYFVFKIVIVDFCQMQCFSQFMDVFMFMYKYDRMGCIVLFQQVF